MAIIDPSVLKDNVFGPAIEQVRRDGNEVLTGLLKHDMGHRAARDQPPASGRAAASRQIVGITVQNLHIGRGHAQFIRHDLGKGRLRSLPVGRNAKVQQNPARGFDDQPGCSARLGVRAPVPLTTVARPTPIRGS